MAGVLYTAVLVAAYASVQQRQPVNSNPGRPIATAVALAIVGLPTLLQLLWVPSLLGYLRRDWDSIMTGQVWRLVTSLVVQDGGLAGAVFNLVSLTVIGLAAEGAWGSLRWVVLALGSGVGAQLWGWFVQPFGAGNSVVVFGLAASLAVLALSEGNLFQRMLAAISLLCSAVLLLTADIHGGAALIGAVRGVVLIRTRPHADLTAG